MLPTTIKKERKSSGGTAALTRRAAGDRNRGGGASTGNGRSGGGSSIGGSGSNGSNNNIHRRGFPTSLSSSSSSGSTRTVWLVLILHSLLIGAQFVFLVIILYFGATNVLLSHSASSGASEDALISSPWNAKALSKSGQYHPLINDGKTNSINDGTDWAKLRLKYDNLRLRMENLEHQLLRGNPDLKLLPADNPRDEDGKVIQGQLKELAEIERKNNQGTLNIASNNGSKKNLVFLHIGKSGGTSFDTAGKKLSADLKMTYVGKKHFDWSYILNRVSGGKAMTPAPQSSAVSATANSTTSASSQSRQRQPNQHKLRENDQCQVITILREPISRAVSHFYFTKNQKWGGEIKNESLYDYLFNTSKEHLLDTRDIWQDGQASVSWLSGTHIASWAQVTKDEVPERERIASNYTAMCYLAASRLQQTRWFGLLEDIDRGLELLQWEFSLPKKPEMKRSNVNKKHIITENEVTQIEKDALASLMPQDIWLYDYAKLLFEARWNEYQTGTYTAPELPPLPNTWPCTSTRFTLNCTSGPLVDVLK